jgi:hypothetical protein
LGWPFNNGGLIMTGWIGKLGPARGYEVGSVRSSWSNLSAGGTPELERQLSPSALGK